MSRAEKKTKVVTITGGTGGFVLLSGLKEYPIHISAIVNMADDGGSTGVLRDDLGVLPPGDVRQCLAALARASSEVRELFSYRFNQGELSGHNAGNLFLSALEKTTGSFSRAVAVAGKILDVYGRVIPVTENDMRLLIELTDGTTLEGESTLDDDLRVRDIGVREVTLAHEVTANKAALDAIDQADVIVIGPGDIYGSIIPSLLVKGIPEALRDTSARIIVVANATNKRGISDGFDAHKYVSIVEKYLLGREVDILMCNTQDPSTALSELYEQQEGEGMFVECEEKETPYRVVGGDFLQETTEAHTRSFIRHDSSKLAKAIIECIDDYE